MVLILILVLMLRTASSHCLGAGSAVHFQKERYGRTHFFVEGTSSYAAALQKKMRSKSRERKREKERAIMQEGD
jgi:uncharacterized protein YxeA